MNAAPQAWTRLGAVPQRDGDLLHLFHKYQTAAEGPSKAAALRQLSAEVGACCRDAGCRR